jgi:nucleolar protein 9
MPKEQRKRGRREEKKRKFLDYEQSQENASLLSKRPKVPSGSLVESTRAEEYPQYLPSTDEGSSGVLPFYGLLDEEEQGYFKRADTLLELNQFANAEERELFLENVYREATGKEHKIANSQSCSRFMERLIRISTPKQVKALFQKFSGQYVTTEHL